VTLKEISDFVNKYEIDIYVETSAKNNYNVEELFQEIIETVSIR
jgi:GTPase SAR1 family protein